MRRSRTRRRRAALAAMLPIAALTTTTTAMAEAPATQSKARIDASARSVPFGDRLTLKGRFPDAANAPIELRHRPKGGAWRTLARTRTGAAGRYAARVKPRATGLWRAELATDPAQTPGLAAATGVDRGTGTERVSVRSRTRAKVKGRHALLGRSVKIRGTVTPAGAQRRVVVRIGSAKKATTAKRNGRFSVAWRPKSTGSDPVVVRARSNRLATGSRDRAGRVTAYRRAAASWYGPGLYGNPMACGGTLTSSTVGVAHRTMRCGAKVRLRYGNRTVKVPVVDRGPFAGNREFDLTSATKQRLGFPDVGTVLTSK